MIFLQRGDFVYVTAEERTLKAMVTLASANGHSLVLMFEGVLGGWVGAMPVLYDIESKRWAALNGLHISLSETRHE